MIGVVGHSAHSSVQRPAHHPDQGLLLDYATGAMAEPSALVIASHLAWCPDCREVIRCLERVGGEFLDQAEQQPVSMACFSRVMARLNEELYLQPPPVLELRSLHSDSGTNGIAELPQPLRSYLYAIAGDDLGTPLTALPWKRYLGGIDEVNLIVSKRHSAAVRVKLTRIRAGLAAPRHTHTGTELTVVLAGGFRDELGSYRRGDVLYHDGSVDHQPVADAEQDCLCLSVLDAPLRLTGPIGRLINPFLRF
ncbi:putative transcriptional regulator [uncultured Gammaproteobacteria bacterium]